MVTRSERFKSCSSHPWYGRLYKKLTQKDINEAEMFLEKNSELPKEQYEIAVNRFYLDRPKDKNWLVITELLARCR